MKKCILLLALVPFLLVCSKHGAVNMQISSYLGTVTVNGKKVTSDQKKIVYGDIIETAKNATCDLLINKKNIFRLQEDTKLVVNITEKSPSFQLEKGGVGSVTKRIFTKLTEYQFYTPTVVASVRGTSYFVKVEKPDSTYFCVCNGEIALKSGSEWKETVTASHHASRRIYKDKNGNIKIKVGAGLLYHDDTSINELAEEINEEIDWDTPDK